jgi:hypothetical protein
MSSNSERDIGDYLTDNSPNEEGTLFLPSPEGHRDPWTLFCAGILAGLAGSVIVTISPWVAGGLISIGYGLAAFSMRGSANSCGRAVCFGFAITALLGAALVAGEAAAPIAVQKLILAAGKHHAIFGSFALMPWALAALKLVRVLVARPRRRTSVQAPSRA